MNALAKSAILLPCLSPILLVILPFMELTSDIMRHKYFNHVLFLYCSSRCYKILKYERARAECKRTREQSRDHAAEPGFKPFNHVVANFQVDSSCLTSDKTKPKHCPNSAPLYIPMSVVNNSAPLYKVYEKVDTYPKSTALI